MPSPSIRAELLAACASAALAAALLLHARRRGRSGVCAELQSRRKSIVDVPDKTDDNEWMRNGSLTGIERTHSLLGGDQSLESLPSSERRHSLIGGDQASDALAAKLAAQQEDDKEEDDRAAIPKGITKRRMSDLGVAGNLV